LVNPNGTVSLVKTTTLAGYRYGVEHYITSFKFQGGGRKFGSIIPLPDVPSKVRRGGDWTLLRLVKEITPPPPPRPTPSGPATTSTTTSTPAQVLYETKIDSVKITILRGGAESVGEWAKDNGFALTPDAPEVLDFYAQRSKIFMALRFDPKDAKKSGKRLGDGVPIHLSIPTENPWVPLRILALGQADYSRVEADVFLLTKREPDLAPTPLGALASSGFVLKRSEPASASLLNDLRSDRVEKEGSMDWVHPSSMWLSYLSLDVDAKDLTYDLSTDVHGGRASAEGAGLVPWPQKPQREGPPAWPWGAASVLGLGSITLSNRLLGRKS
jgi:hypothetical protein